MATEGAALAVAHAPKRLHVRRPRSSSTAGDLVVTQTRSAIGEKPRVVKTLRALGLRHIGAERYHHSNPAIEGMLHTVRHLVVVRRLGVSRFALELYRGRPHGSKEVVVTDYLLLDKPAKRLELAEGEFVAVEVYDGECSLTWTCDLGAEELASRLARVIPGDGDSPTRVESADGQTGEYRSLLAAAEAGTQGWSRVEIDCLGLSLLWDAVQIRRVGKNPLRLQHGRLGVTSDVFDLDLLTDLVHLTGSDAVARSAGKVRDNISFVGDHLEVANLRQEWSHGGREEGVDPR